MHTRNLITIHKTIHACNLVKKNQNLSMPFAYKSIKHAKTVCRKTMTMSMITYVSFKGKLFRLFLNLDFFIELPNVETGHCPVSISVKNKALKILTRSCSDVERSENRFFFFSFTLLNLTH